MTQRGSSRRCTNEFQGGSLDDDVNALGRGNRSKVGGIESLWWEFASRQDWVATEGVRGWDWRRREI